jgi:hypothetical protein
MSRHPDVELAESELERFFEFQKELEVLGSFGHINEEPDQFITIRMTFVFQQTTNDLCLGGHGSESLPQLKQGIGEQLIRDGLLIVKPQGQKDFVSPE